MQTVRTTQKTAPQTDRQAPAPQPTERLEAVARRVAQDARQTPAAYREETRVPAGGG